MLTRILLITLTIGITACTSLTPLQKYQQNLSDGAFTTSLTKDEFQICLNKNLYLMEQQKFSTWGGYREALLKDNVYGFFNESQMVLSPLGGRVETLIHHIFVYQENSVNSYGLDGLFDAQQADDVFLHYKNVCG